jgi:curved DNA-binding protein CbpA
MASLPVDNVHLYQVLGLRRTDASAEDIKRAYRRMAVKCHPDRNSDADSTAKFQA